LTGPTSLEMSRTGVITTYLIFEIGGDKRISRHLSGSVPLEAQVLTTDARFSSLTLQEDSKPLKAGKQFPSDTKSEAFMKEAIATAMTCKICEGYIHVNSITVDHIERKEDGGSGTIDNAQLAHPYCNTGYKEMQASQQSKKGE
jgi:hypothetical protein